MPKTVFVADLRPDVGQFKSYFLVLRKEAAVTASGKAYVKLTLGDKSGKIEARCWDHSHVPVDVDDYVGVEALTNEWEGKTQLKISKIRKVDPAIDVGLEDADFFPCSERDRVQMLGELNRVVTENVVGPLMQNLLLRVIQNSEISTLLVDAPAGMSMHHAYRGGLLGHILSLIDLSIRVAKAYEPKLDRDLLIAAAILHDIGKIYEYNFQRAIRFAVAGRLRGHIAMGCEIAVRFAAEVGMESPDTALLLHMILSHHGELEFGSPIRPAIREAVVFHYLDQIDGRLAAIDAAEKMAEPGDEMTGYVPMLGGAAVIVR